MKIKRYPWNGYKPPFPMEIYLNDTDIYNYDIYRFQTCVSSLSNCLIENKQLFDVKTHNLLFELIHSNDVDNIKIAYQIIKDYNNET